MSSVCVWSTKDVVADSLKGSTTTMALLIRGSTLLLFTIHFCFVRPHFYVSVVAT